MELGVWDPSQGDDISQGINEVSLMKPLTFMNNSGNAVVPYAQYNGISPSEILVIHDELDFPSGKIRYKFGGSEAGNKGLKSISSCFASKDYWRLRIGIGRPPSSKQVIDYVLHSPTPEERDKYHVAIALVLDSLQEFVWGDKQLAINQLNNMHKSSH